MRTKTFRREQEEKHFKKRLNFYVKFGRFGSVHEQTEDGRIDFNANLKLEPRHVQSIGSSNKPIIKDPNFDIEAEKEQRWTKKLKNGDVKLWYSMVEPKEVDESFVCINSKKYRCVYSLKYETTTIKKEDDKEVNNILN